MLHHRRSTGWCAMGYYRTNEGVLCDVDAVELEDAVQRFEISLVVKRWPKKPKCLWVYRDQRTPPNHNLSHLSCFTRATNDFVRARLWPWHGRVDLFDSYDDYPDLFQISPTTSFISKGGFSWCPAASESLVPKPDFANIARFRYMAVCIDGKRR